jgi:acyl-CoA thioester hydrolase
MTTAPRHAAQPFRVRYAETDQMGIVYHPNYLVWCEIGRTEFMAALGVRYADVERGGIFLAVAETAVRFVASARYDDLIRVETWIDRVQSRAITFGYEIRRVEPGPGVRLALASTKLIATTREGMPRSLPDHLLGAFRHAVLANPA